ncbi:hypothetical protein MJO29_003622 [Puccinia striiformis f. sp. tritici]|uniref:hypothetical protein n=1 Tax=Puccinia striiformis f. sp. tritici TaxID=168172 RepID=UPI00200795A2|nr:hypothetical protein Pst134EA_006725 [Puccinia striiformis f. sp. tritici]KAH9469435.1 hypothetical protein Pst134EA_006725 [Puccinia striiformis f. sp. tritici]KAI7963195.1 hypothetical protein MJO29_003622 [Puccinia striiformis f. sp. tritici]
MGGFGFKSRHKQSAPEPLKVKGQFKDTKKNDPQPEAEEPNDLPKKKSRSKVPRSGGKSVASKIKQRSIRQQEEAQEQEIAQTKLAKKENGQDSDSGSNDGDSDEDSDEDGDEDEGEEKVDEGLEEARKAFFSTKDLVEPQNNESSEPSDSQSASGSSHAGSIEGMIESEAGDELEGSVIPDDEDDDDDDNDDEAAEEFGSDDEDFNDAEDEDDNALDADIMNHNKGVPDLRKLYIRIQESVRVLANWGVLGKKAKGKSRADLTEQTLNDVCEYFGYNAFLSDLLWQLFDPEEALAFFEANETARPVTIRTNTLRTNRRDLAQLLINRGVNLEPIGKWSKVGLQVFESSVPIGATPEYLAGHYMLQAASSFLPVIALDPRPGEKCLDMSAAPGGKTTFMSAMMKNTGKLFANDSSKARCKSLTANVSRMGCHNVIISNHDARDFPKVMGGFNRVLLDAPCSGTGVISKDASVKNNKSEKDLLLLSHLQKQLILCAIDSVSPHSPNGGYLVYSTCSVTVEENESVVNYALKQRPNVKLVETGIGFGKEGFVRFRGKIFNPSLKLTRRFYPHVHNVDGFYVAKFKVNPKLKTTPAQDADDAEENVSPEDEPDKKQKAVKEDAEPITFDDSEDADIIAAAKISQLKAKGVHVTRPNPEKAQSKKHQLDEQDGVEKKHSKKQQPDHQDRTEKVQSKKHGREEQDGKEKKKKKTKVKAT